MRHLRSLLVLAHLVTLTACSSSPPEESPEGGDNEKPLLPGQSGDFCQAPTPELDGFISLDRELFVQRLSDSLVGWMTPLHESLLPLDEARFLEIIQETVLGTFDTKCKPERDLEFLPPEDTLIDPEAQRDVRESIEALFKDAIVLPTEDPTVLRLSIHECSDCDGALGTTPSFLTVRLTESGVLALEYELSEGEVWSKHLYVTPDSLILQGELAALSDWTDTLTESTREGKLKLPNGTGRLIAILNKTETGQLSVNLGLSDFSLESDTENVPHASSLILPASASTASSTERKGAQRSRSTRARSIWSSPVQAIAPARVNAA